MNLTSLSHEPAGRAVTWAWAACNNPSSASVEGCLAKMQEAGTQVTALKDPDAFRQALAPIQKEFGDKFQMNEVIAKIKATD